MSLKKSRKVRRGSSNIEYKNDLKSGKTPEELEKQKQGLFQAIDNLRGYYLNHMCTSIRNKEKENMKNELKEKYEEAGRTVAEHRRIERETSLRRTRHMEIGFQEKLKRDGISKEHREAFSRIFQKNSLLFQSNEDEPEPLAVEHKFRGVSPKNGIQAAPKTGKLASPQIKSPAVGFNSKSKPLTATNQTYEDEYQHPFPPKNIPKKPTGRSEIMTDEK